MIQLTYRYNELDKRKEFGLETDLGYLDNWLWFYLGKEISDYVNLFPYRTGKICLRVKSKGDAERDAKMIVKEIYKKLNSK